jgi:hypothetical protein
MREVNTLTNDCSWRQRVILSWKWGQRRSSLEAGIRSKENTLAYKKINSSHFRSLQRR